MNDRILLNLAETLEQRKASSADESYVAALYAGGDDSILKKVGEEATEVILAAKGTDIWSEKPQTYGSILWFCWQKKTSRLQRYSLNSSRGLVAPGWTKKPHVLLERIKIMMPSIPQLLIILVIVVLLFGAKRLRNLGGDLGGAVKGFKKAMSEEEKEDTQAQLDEAKDDAIESTVVKESDKPSA